MSETRPPLSAGLLTIATILVLSLTLMVGAQAREPGPGPGGHCMAPPHPAPGMPGLPGSRGEMPPEGLPATFGIERVGLDEAQQDQVFTLLHERAPALREARKAVSRPVAELQELVRIEPFDPARARALATAQGAAVTRLALLESELQAALRALLTAEQRRLLDSPMDCRDKP